MEYSARGWLGGASARKASLRANPADCGALYLIKNGTRVHHKGWWLAGGAVVLTISIVAGLEHQHRLFDDYPIAFLCDRQMFLATQPVPLGSEIHSIALLPSRIPQGHDRRRCYSYQCERRIKR